MAFPNDGHRFRPGQSGNPAGRPRGRSVTARLREKLEAQELGGKSLGGRQVADLLTDVITHSALRGDIRFVQLLLDRTERYDELVEQVEELREELRRSRDPGDAGGAEGGGQGRLDGA